MVKEDPAVTRVREFEAGVGHVLGCKPSQGEQDRAVPSTLRPRGRWGCVWVDGVVWKLGRRVVMMLVCARSCQRSASSCSRPPPHGAPQT